MRIGTHLLYCENAIEIGLDLTNTVPSQTLVDASGSFGPSAGVWTASPLTSPA